MNSDGVKVRRSDRVPAFKTSHRIEKLFFNTDTSANLPRNTEMLSHNPPVYMIKNFLSEGELNFFNKICTQYGKQFCKSFTEDDDNGRVISEERTSTYIFLSKCQDHFTRRVEQKAADFVGISPCNVEPLQIVSYTDGQKFNLHHDAGTLDEDGAVDLVPPRRLATFFVYLNSLPEGEGHTSFPEIGLSVRPTRNSAVLFCNILPDGQPDPRVVHQARPVSSAWRKFGMNIWISDSSLQALASLPPRTPLKHGLLSADEASMALTRAERKYRVYVDERAGDEKKDLSMGKDNKTRKKKKDAPSKRGVVDIAVSSAEIGKQKKRQKSTVRNVTIPNS